MILNMVGKHLEQREFISPALSERLLPAKTDIIYKSALDQEAREDALPVVAYSTGGFTFTPFSPAHNFGGNNSTAIQLSGSINFLVSTPNESLTAELGFEIAAFLCAMIKDLRTLETNVASVQLSELSKDKGNYVLQSVQTNLMLGFPVWKTDKMQAILREIGVSAEIR